MAKFATNGSGAMLSPSLIKVTESISGSVVPLAMFYEQLSLWLAVWLSQALSGSLWLAVRLAVRLSLALSGSLWLTLARCPTLSGSLWLFQALSGSLWLSQALSGSLLLSKFAYQALARPTRPLLSSERRS